MLYKSTVVLYLCAQELSFARKGVKTQTYLEKVEKSITDKNCKSTFPFSTLTLYIYIYTYSHNTHRYMARQKLSVYPYISNNLITTWNMENSLLYIEQDYEQINKTINTDKDTIKIKLRVQKISGY